MALLEQVGEGGPDRVGDAEHVGQDHRPPVLGRFLEEAAGGAEAGVREDDVDAAEALERRLDEGGVLLPLGDVADLDHDLGALVEAGGELVERLAAPGGENEAVSLGV